MLKCMLSVWSERNVPKQAKTPALLRKTKQLELLSKSYSKIQYEEYGVKPGHF